MMKSVLRYGAVFLAGGAVGAAVVLAAPVMGAKAVFDMWTDIAAGEMLQRAGHVSYIRLGEPESAVALMDQALAVQFQSIMARRETPADFGEQQALAMRQVATYMRQFPEAFEDVMALPGFAAWPPLSDAELEGPLYWHCDPPLRRLLRETRDLEAPPPAPGVT